MARALSQGPEGTNVKLAAFPCTITPAAALDKWGDIVDNLWHEYRKQTGRCTCPTHTDTGESLDFRSNYGNEPEQTQAEKDAFAVEISTWES